MNNRQTVDPAVSRAKFDQEIEQFRGLEAVYRRRGILLLDAAFPMATVAFCGFKLQPVALLGAIRIDFTDYDLLPPSVRFVDPLTGDDLRANAMTLQLLRLPAVEGMTRETQVTLLAQGSPIGQPANLVQANGPEELPFLCLPSVREYHDNPAHTGDPWLLHRASGEGSLAFIVENIWKYGPNALDRYVVQAVMEGGGLRLQTIVETAKVSLGVSIAALAH